MWDTKSESSCCFKRVSLSWKSNGRTSWSSWGRVVTVPYRLRWLWRRSVDLVSGFFFFIIVFFPVFLLQIPSHEKVDHKSDQQSSTWEKGRERFSSSCFSFLFNRLRNIVLDDKRKGKNQSKTFFHTFRFRSLIRYPVVLLIAKQSSAQASLSSWLWFDATSARSIAVIVVDRIP